MINLHKKIILGAAIVIAIVAILTILIIAQSRPHTGSEFHSKTVSTISNSQVEPTPLPPTPTPEPGYTLLLMGKGGAGHEGGGLTDTMILVRILDTTKKILLLTIPRDLWVEIGGTSGTTKGKINSASALGGGVSAKSVVEQVSGLAIDKYITIDFSGFEQAIDSIGGVDINVLPAFTDYEYPIAGREDLDCSTFTPPTAGTSPSPLPTDISVALSDLVATGKLDASKLTGLPSQFLCRYEMLHFDAGLQHMDGVTALKFVRSRHSAESGNDFARGQRQQQVIEAVVTKLFTLGAISKVPTFFSTLRSHIDTDLSAGDLLSFLPQATTLRSYQVIQTALTTDNYLKQAYTIDRQFALFPITGEENYVAIHNWISSLITPGISLQYPVIQVESDSKNASSSARLVSELNEAGYPAHSRSLTTKTATTSSTLVVQNTNVDVKTAQAIKSIISSFSLRVVIPKQ